MPQFIAKEAGVQVYGAAVIAIVEGNEAFRNEGYKILAQYGIVDLQIDKWYPQEAWLNCFRELARKFPGNTLRIIGNQIPRNAVWPESIHTVADALASIDIAYHINHRGGEIGHYLFVPLSQNSGRMICDNPYPCEFDQGIIEEVVKQFISPQTQIRISHDTSQPCRSRGGERCTYQIDWEI